MPTHYGFKVSEDTDAIAREYDRLKDLPARKLKTPASLAQRKATERLLVEVKAILAAQDARGRWVEEGRLRSHAPHAPATRIIRCATFVHNMETLSRYLAATRP